MRACPRVWLVAAICALLAVPRHAGAQAPEGRTWRLAVVASTVTSLEVTRSSLLGFGPDIHDLRRRSANLIARVLRGARPGNIPIEQPTRFSLGVNLATAQALGATLPAAVMAQADEVFD